MNTTRPGNNSNAGSSKRILLAACCLALAGHASAGDPALPKADSPETALAALSELARNALGDKRQTLPGTGDWLFLSSELRHLGAGPFWGEAAAAASQAKADPDPEAAILDLNQKLDELGIALIVMPVPARAAIYPDRLVSGLPLDAGGIPPRIDLNDREFGERLRKAGVQVIDLTGDFLAARAGEAAKGPPVCQQDTHWSPRGIEIAADRLAAAIGRPAWLESARRTDSFRLKSERIPVLGDLVGRTPGHPETRIELPATRISSTPDAFTPLATSEASPVILLADSHGLVFHSGGDMHAEGAGLADHLAHRLGIPMDLMARKGSGASVRIDLARRFLQDPEWVQSKRLVIYCFAARFLTESDSWKPVPLKK